MEATVLLKEELELLQSMSKDYVNAKNGLGDLELRKHDILNDMMQLEESLLRTKRN